MASGLEREIESAIALVDDPCSIAAKAPLNVFELGLVRDWSVDPDGDVEVVLSPTSPSCVLIGSIMEGVEKRVGRVPGVRSVKVELDGETFWTPELMSETGRRKLANRHQESMKRVPVRPREWQQVGSSRTGGAG
ncbi:MAG TPA: metal-sulfur cluster assembly factor [Solirubrobacterales bacterium]|jgi:metal-sulfur cluster biosynthetic enzyme|nr:metal-sulfur cluster assembly factor [Solirubrobacterales bacterium]